MKFSLQVGVSAALFLTGSLLPGCGPREASSTAPSTTPGSPAVQKTFLIGVSQANKGEPWRQAMNDQISAAAALHPELKVVFADAAQSNTKQVADVESFLQQGINLLIISPNEAGPLTDVVAKAYDQHIPVILLDRKVNGDKYTMWIGGDNKAIGIDAGKYVAKWCQDNGHDPCSVAEIRGLEGSTPAQERGAGFRTGIADNKSVKIVASQNADWLREKALPVAQSMLQANANVDVIFSHNDPMAAAAILAATTAHKDLSKMLFVGIDGLPTPDGGIKSVQAGRQGVTYVYPTGGAAAIDSAVKILEKNQTPPKNVILPTDQVTQANAAQMLAKYGAKS
ncbi:MAG: substrate-binding domain-containing protein [Janthinobacterium lividum]